jgi:hypothetical protein
MTLKKFITEDQSRTLFPLKTNRLLLEHGEGIIKDYVAKCLDNKEKAHSFLPQQRVYAAKHGLGLRRTLKLDVASEYFLYDSVYSQRARFRKPHANNRVHFGYRFENGEPITATNSYKAFKTAITKYMKLYRYFICFDVASYFNSIYHHDLVSWLSELGVSTEECENFGQFFREINAGRSVDFMPQGLYASKMLGNDFLRFVDNSLHLRSGQLLRFMDDFYLFSNNVEDISKDFLTIQHLLGEKSLNINPKKTSQAEAGHTKIAADIDAVKKALLDRRREIVRVGYDEDEEITVKKPLSKREHDYIISLLTKESLDEEDAELILSVMGECATKAEGKLGYILSSFPSLTKSVYKFCAHIQKKDFITELLIQITSSNQTLQEYQLFWFACIVDEYLLGTSGVSTLISNLYHHPRSTNISRAKILEIPDKRFGLPELRANLLRSGQSDWLSWSAAMGERRLNAAARNHGLNYFSKGSPMNYLISQIVSVMPSNV